MFLATDTYYNPDNTAKAVGILFQNWDDQVPMNTIEVHIPQVAEYEPGAFYKRELPCIMAMLEHCDLAQLDAIIVDGYVFLDDHGKMGLGAHLYDALGGRIPVIGVAKTSFHDNHLNVIEVKRGESTHPLYISSIGIQLATAAAWIESMYGPYRMPHLLKVLDGLTRT